MKSGCFLLWYLAHFPPTPAGSHCFLLPNTLLRAMDVSLALPPLFPHKPPRLPGPPPAVDSPSASNGCCKDSQGDEYACRVEVCPPQGSRKQVLRPA